MFKVISREPLINLSFRALARNPFLAASLKPEIYKISTQRAKILSAKMTILNSSDLP